MPRQRFWGRIAFARTLFILIVALLSVSRGSAQQSTADILGTVTDPDGSVVPSALVLVQNVETQATRTTQTDIDGAYVVNDLAVGNYSVTITAKGFKTFAVPSLALSGSDRARVDAQLQIGEVSQTVSVGGQAPALQTDTAVMSQNINNTAVQDLPLNGRNYAVLATLVPGANDGPETGSLDSGTALDDRMPKAALSVNGQSDILNEQLIDGADNHERVISQVGVRPSVDSIQEVDVQTSNYSAEYGRTAGGVVNIITKAGTNAFHGDLFEYLRNDLFDATPYQIGKQLPKAALRQNQFGGSLGGPVVKNRTFFFFSYEGFRQITASNPTTAVVPTLYEEQHPGDFSDTTTIANSKCLASAAVCTPCPSPVAGNCPLIIPASSIDQVGLDYFDLYPAPNSGINGFAYTAKISATIGTYSFRIDHQINKNNTLFWRYIYNNADSTAPGGFPYKTVAGIKVNPLNGSTYPEFAGNIMAGYLHTFGNSLLLDLRASYTRINNRAYAQNSGLNANTTFGQPNVNSDACGGQTNLAPIQVTAGASLSSQFRPTKDQDNTFQYMGALIYSLGTHDMKIGGRIIRRQLNHVQCGTGMGLWAFSDYPSLIVGLYNNTSRSLSFFTPTFRVWEPGVYFQDNWRARRNLALNLGIRYDVFTPYSEKNGHIANFDPTTAQLLIAGTNGVSNTGNVHTDFLDFQPRVGIVYTIRDGLVLRGGFGESFVPGGSQLTNPPFIASFGPCGVVAAGTYGNSSKNNSPCPTGFTKFANGFPVATPASANPITGNVSGVQFNIRTTHVFQYNVTVQKDFFGGNVATLSYVGIQGRDLAGGIADLNGLAPGECGASCIINNLRPFNSVQPLMGKVSYAENLGRSNYNSLQASLERRLKRGLTVNANFNWSHLLDDVDSQSSGSALNAGAGLVPGDPMFDYGNGTLDLRNRLAVAANYELPFGNGRSGLVKALSYGWHLNIVDTWQTGQGFTVLNSSNVSNTTTGTNDRAEVVANPWVPGPVAANPSCTNAPAQVHTQAAWFNPCAIMKQPIGTMGNERRNQLFGPHFRHFDLSLFKTFPIRESLAMDFRFEGVNVTNTANLAQPTANDGSSTYGQIITTNPSYNPRQLQFALILHF